jgi:hypothetical protein
MRKYIFTIILTFISFILIILYFTIWDFVPLSKYFISISSFSFGACVTSILHDKSSGDKKEG